MDGWRERLAFEIHARGHKLTKLSTSLGFHRDYVSNILSGKAKPSTDKLEMICKEIGVPFAKVLLGEPDAESTDNPTSRIENPALSSVQSMIVGGDFTKSNS